MDTNTTETVKVTNGGNKTVGLIILLLVLLLIAGAFVYLRGDKESTDNGYTTGQTQTDSVTESLNVQSDNDDLGAIETDLNATDIDSIDSTTP